jgi:hypothetical protein
MLGPVETGVLQLEYLHRTSPAKEVRMTPNIADIIRHHVSLELRCIDRVYLHAYMPKLQTSGGLCYFLHDHLGYPVLASPPQTPCAATISLASSCRRCVQEGTVCDVESGAGERQQYAAKSMELDLEPVN